MTTLDEVVTWSDGVLKTIEGLHAYGDRIPDDVNYPCAMTYPVPALDYRDSAEDGEAWLFRIVLLVAASFSENQRSALPFLERTGFQSIFAAYESRRGSTTGFDARIVDAEPLTQQEVAGYRGTGAGLTLHVFVD